ncbi:MAG: isoprenylcysteine carboxylmethyltransferase family protein [Burkholderiales bacterium]|nr:isoprenylcysteine carboxylmethyltransferase family protein [Burkholderiales bacterium]
MTTPTVPPRVNSRALLLETTLRVLAVLAYGAFVAAVFNQWRLAPQRLSLLVLVAIDAFTLCLLVFAREAKFRDLSPLAATSTALATFYFVLLNLAPGRQVVPELVAVAIQGLGMTLQVWAKVTLGRSFGLLPAHRGVVTSGPYAWVRHPIYLGYLVSHIGFLLANLSVRNFVVLVGLYGLQMVRMVLEERVLGCASAEYRSYLQTVRWRFVPGVL